MLPLLVATASYVLSIMAEQTSNLQSALESPPPLSPPLPPGRHFDLLILGSDPAGLSLAKEASILGATVCVVRCSDSLPCCFEAKLQQFCSNFGSYAEYGFESGWEIPQPPKHIWEAVPQILQKCDWFDREKTTLQRLGVLWLDFYGRFYSEQTISVTHTQILDENDREIERITAEKVALAVGTHPDFRSIPNLPASYLTPRSLLSSPSLPSPVLILGASQSALECCSFLISLHKSITILKHPGPILPHLDREMIGILTHDLESRGVRFLRNAQITEMTQIACDSISIEYTDSGYRQKEEFGTVVVAFEPVADTEKVGIEAIGLAAEAESGRISVDTANRTAVNWIWAVGDCCAPGAANSHKAGQLLAQRLFGDTLRTDPARMLVVPHYISTPVPYSYIGYSEEAACSEYGLDAVEVYQTHFGPVEWAFGGRGKYAMGKMICRKMEGKKILGVHYCGPDAQEIIQSFAIALQAGATKATFDETVGMRPTCAEEFVYLKVTKSSGANPRRTD